MHIQGLPRPVRVAHAQKILDAIKSAQPVEGGTGVRKIEELPRQQFQVDAIYAMAQALCMSRGVDPQLAFSRADVSDLLHNATHQKLLDTLRLMQGWRREVIGAALADICANGGEIGLAIQQQHLSATRRS